MLISGDDVDRWGVHNNAMHKHLQCTHSTVHCTHDEQEAHDRWLRSCFGKYDAHNHWTAGDNWMYSVHCESVQLNMEVELVDMLRRLQRANLLELRGLCHDIAGITSLNKREFVYNVMRELAGRRTMGDRRRAKPDHSVCAFAREIEALVEDGDVVRPTSTSTHALALSPRHDSP